jgi:DNA-binding MarR family transcriptional regulator
MEAHGPETRKEVVLLPCACASLRRAARIVTQLYDHELEPEGLKATQFTLLQALTEARNISQGRLGDLLGLDSTTLSRTLALLRKKRWIQATPGEDRRELRLSLTSEGKRKYQSALKHWRSAQRQLRRALGEAAWNKIMEATTSTARFARQP